ncbi:MAG: XRE family transcriptional regulator [Rhodospirillaceae bacterium]|nr:MAG: XRE family transcriptional regulator [Rhodospirillaceae bacterium]
MVTLANGELANFAANLRYLCALEGPVSEVCRRMDLNRQQFARYLTGTAKPSAHNVIRICEHFHIPENSLDLQHDQFVLQLRAGHATTRMHAS